MAKKLLCVVLCVLMVVAMMPTSAFAATFNYIYVNGVDITTATNYTVQCGSGTAVYDPNTYTITLTNATIDTFTNSAAIYVYCTSASNAPSEGVTVNLVGDNYIVGTGTWTYGIMSRYCTLNISSTKNGSLSISDVAIGLNPSNATVNITDCILNITGSSSSAINTTYPVNITNSLVTIYSTTSASGINGSGSVVLTITDSDVDITTYGTCIALQRATYSLTSSTLYVESSQLTCTRTNSGNYAIYCCGMTVSGDTTLVADGGLNL